MNNKTRIFSAIILILVISITIYTPIFNSTLEYKLVYSTQLYLLAIREGFGGEVINTTLNIYYPGTGSVYVKVENGEIADDTITSFKYALILASLLTGVDYKAYDYELVFPPNTKLRGPSATLEFFLGLASFFTKKKPSMKIGSTGVIAPNGLVGLVEGLDEKYSAGIDYGLNYVIGPPSKNMTNATLYHPVIDVFNAYREYIGLNLYNVSISQYFTRSYERYYEIIDKVFMYSYFFFKNKTSEILKKYAELGIRDYNSLKGYKYYVLALKYGNKSLWYTASSYCFRAYTELYTRFFNILFEHSRADALDQVNSLSEKIREEITAFVKLFRKRMEVVHDIWDLDALINSYIRLRIALEAYFEGRLTGNFIEKARLYTLSLARIYTARHWIMLLENKTYYGRWFVSREYSIANNYLREYLVKSIEYFKAVKIFDDKTMLKFKQLIQNISGSPLSVFVNYTYESFELAYISQSLEPPIFSQFLDEKIIAQLNNTLKLLTLYIWENTYSIPPSSITLFELMRNYMSEKENITLIGYLYSSAFSTLIPYVVLINSLSLYNPLQATIHTKTVIKPLNIEYNTIYIMALILGVTGAFLIGLSIGRLRE